MLDEQTPQIVWQQYLVQRSFAFSPAAKPNGSLVPVSVSTLAAATDGNRCGPDVQPVQVNACNGLAQPYDWPDRTEMGGVF